MAEGRHVYDVSEDYRIPLAEDLVVFPVEFEAHCEMTGYFLSKTRALFVSDESVSELPHELVDPQSHKFMRLVAVSREHSQHPMEHSQ